MVLSYNSYNETVENENEMKDALARMKFGIGLSPGI
jgi:hypothetical protein